MAKQGGAFILAASEPKDIFTVDDFTEEDRLFAKTANDFVMTEVVPRKAESEADDTKLKVQRELLEKAGELGLLMVEIPEAYDGLGQGLKQAMFVSENLSKVGSFTTSIVCHTGIGTLPIVYFGTEDQKKRYLPKLATGEWIGAYALTEEGYGSDALGAKTKAVKSEDGKSWILNGVKQFITNAGFADLFTVFAKVDGEQFSCFLVETTTPGVSTSCEEHKMGIKGSSTRQLILKDVKVPLENLLGEVGKGHRIALNILNIGRLKLGLASLGGTKYFLSETVKYTTERKQFGKPISEFQLIKRKTADVVTGIYAVESMAYRCAGDIDEAIHGIDVPVDHPEFPTKKIAAIEQFAIEAAMLKVYGSEMLSRSVDEMLQAHGGYGFIEDYLIAGAYRDARINSLFEGTNEVNRMLIPGTLMKRAMKGQLDLMTPVFTLLGELKADSINKTPAEGTLGREKTAVDILRKHAVYAMGLIAQKAMANQAYLMDNQILLEQVADLGMALYAADSTLLRTLKAIERDGEAKHDLAIKAAQIIVYEALRRGQELTRQIAANLSADDAVEFGKCIKALARLNFDYGLNTMALKDQLAQATNERLRYPIG